MTAPLTAERRQEVEHWAEWHRMHAARCIGGGAAEDFEKTADMLDALLAEIDRLTAELATAKSAQFETDVELEATRLRLTAETVSRKDAGDRVIAMTAERNAAVAAAVMAEREECAELCDAVSRKYDLRRERNDEGIMGEVYGARDLAKAIRSRPAPAPAVEGRTP